ncbi:MAG: hypothetical protein IPK75_00735 [Acidobacteria bacterium]|nr:hypothetical protein [Acidobacteriota bacterium]
MQPADTELPDRPAARKRPARSRFFLAASAVMTAIVFLGFLPSFYARPYFRDTPLPAYLILHGLIMTAWQSMFLIQTTLIARRNTRLHRQLGVAGAALAALVVIAGVYATLRQPGFYAARAIELPFPLEPLVIPNLLGFLLFGSLVAAAIHFRRNSAAHSRLFFWAFVVTMGPAVTPVRTLGSIIAPYFPVTFPPEIALVWIAWAAILIHDWTSARRFHPVSVAGGFLILFVTFSIVDWVLLIEPLGDWTRSLEAWR